MEVANPVGIHSTFRKSLSSYTAVKCPRGFVVSTLELTDESQVLTLLGYDVYNPFVVTGFVETLHLLKDSSDGEDPWS